MLVVALIFVVVAVILFLIDASGKVADRPLQSLGLASGFAGLACWLIDVLQAQGKL